ncbi:hypothetical protein GPECTOR_27g722 [Gonium pectorale]|uniref:TPM domain-containing protein n=1 Tax=Gonium pectorale TaxID=33097 RepID=A0A150GFB8_GONPE|nr:hypothetical protein GPECTOR_27g722 [Gonium pectorale]|eukprot:KXZ48551.1 hypothetical protein GPECTOR_27g722 [Gonium pectorale]
MLHHASPLLRQRKPFGSQRPAAAATVVRCSALPKSEHQQQQQQEQRVELGKRIANAALAGIAAVSILASGAASARPSGVNRPELLPPGAEVTPVIDVAGFLTPSEEKRIATEVTSLERDTGFKLRVLAQNYPETPGLAIREYWGVDDNTVVFVADPTFGDILNFNVGAGIDLEVPRVSAIDTCLREEPGRFKCSTVQGDLGEKPSSGPFGKAFGQ